MNLTHIISKSTAGEPLPEEVIVQVQLESGFVAVQSFNIIIPNKVTLNNELIPHSFHGELYLTNDSPKPIGKNVLLVKIDENKFIIHGCKVSQSKNLSNWSITFDYSKEYEDN